MKIKIDHAGQARRRDVSGRGRRRAISLECEKISYQFGFDGVWGHHRLMLHVCGEAQHLSTIHYLGWVRATHR